MEQEFEDVTRPAFKITEAEITLFCLILRPENTHKGQSGTHHNDLSLLYWSSEGNLHIIQSIFDFSLAKVSSCFSA